MDRTLQILARAAAIPGEPAAESHGVENMVRIGLLRQRAGEMMSGLFDIAGVQALDTVIEVIFRAEVPRCNIRRAPFADLDVGPRLVGNGSRRAFGRFKEQIARFGQFALRE